MIDALDHARHVAQVGFEVAQLAAHEQRPVVGEQAEVLTSVEGLDVVGHVRAGRRDHQAQTRDDEHVVRGQEVKGARLAPAHDDEHLARGRRDERDEYERHDGQSLPRERPRPVARGRVHADDQHHATRVGVEHRRKARHERAVVVTIGPDRHRPRRREHRQQLGPGLVVDGAGRRRERVVVVERLGAKAQVGAAQRQAVGAAQPGEPSVGLHLPAQLRERGSLPVGGLEPEPRHLVGVDRAREPLRLPQDVAPHAAIGEALLRGGHAGAGEQRGEQQGEAQQAWPRAGVGPCGPREHERREGRQARRRQRHVDRRVLAHERDRSRHGEGRDHTGAHEHGPARACAQALRGQRREQRQARRRQDAHHDGRPPDDAQVERAESESARPLRPAEHQERGDGQHPPAPRPVARPREREPRAGAGTDAAREEEVVEARAHDRPTPSRGRAASTSGCGGVIRCMRRRLRR